ncbi:MAG: hypothetical protein ABIL52_08370 [candidate division WOR-3 bacterium]
MKKLLILILIVQSIIIVVGGFYVYKNYIVKEKELEKKEPVETIIREKLELPSVKEEENVKNKMGVVKEQKETTFNKLETKIDTPMLTQPLPQNIPMDTAKSLTQPQVPEIKEVKETKTNPTDIKVNVDIGKIDIPKVGPEVGGGVSVSGALAIQQAYEELHDLNKTIQLANEMLKSNPNDQTAQKYKKLAELEIMANEALSKGDRQSALNYFYQMQSIDPNNKWARKGIMKIMSGG